MKVGPRAIAPGRTRRRRPSAPVCRGAGRPKRALARRGRDFPVRRRPGRRRRLDRCPRPRLFSAGPFRAPPRIGRRHRRRSAAVLARSTLPSPRR